MKVNYKSDFTLTIQLSAGGAAIAAPAWDWQLRFYTNDRQAVYIAGRKGGVADRCAVNGDGTITVFFDKHGLRPGALLCEFVNLVPDANFSFDTQVNVDPVVLDVELWTGASDGGMDAVALELAGSILAEMQALAEQLEASVIHDATWVTEPTGLADDFAALVDAVDNGNVVAVGGRVAVCEVVSDTEVRLTVAGECDADGGTLSCMVYDVSLSGDTTANTQTVGMVGGNALSAGEGISITGNVVSTKPVVVTLSPVDGHADRVSPDKTYAEVAACIDAGLQVWFDLQGMYYPVTAKTSTVIQARLVDGVNVSTLVWQSGNTYLTVEERVLQQELAAGAGVEISGTEISAPLAVPLVVNLTAVEGHNDRYTPDKTYGEAHAAYLAGRKVQFRVSQYGLSVTLDVTVDFVGTMVAVLHLGEAEDMAAALMLWMSNTPEHVRKEQIDLQHALSFDTAPTADSSNPVTSDGVYTALGGKQDTLVSGTSIKTINNTSLLGSGNISLPTAAQVAANHYSKTEIDNMIGDIESLLAAI